MKEFKYLALFIIGLVLVSSCKKDKDVIITVSFENRNVTQSEGDTYSLIIKSDVAPDANKTIYIKASYNASVTIGADQDLLLSKQLVDDTLTVIIPKGSNSTTLEINTFQDFTEENTEEISFQIINKNEPGILMGEITLFEYTLIDSEFANPVNFSKASITQTEGDEICKIVLKTAHPVTYSKYVKLNISSPNGLDYLTGNDVLINQSLENNQINLEIQAGKDSTYFTIESMNDFIEELDENISFSIAEVSDGINIGNNSTLNYTLEDLPFDNPINFEDILYSASENDYSSYQVILNTLHPVTWEKQIKIHLTYSQEVQIGEDGDFETSKTIINDTITLNVLPNKDTTSFKIYPKNDLAIENDETIIFEIVKVTDGIMIGDSKEFSYTIRNVDNLVANYPLDGDALDVKNNNNGTLYGPILTENRKGESNKALYFDGIDDYINIPHSELINFDYNQDFSISVWIEPALNQNNLNGISNAIIYKWDDLGSTAYPYCIRYFNETENKVDYTEYTISCARHDYYSLESEVLSNTTARNNGWNHIVLVKEGSNLKIYQNGILKDTETDNSSGSTKNNLDVTIGARLPGHPTSDRYFTGKIDDIKFYSIALSADEVSSLYNE